MTIPEFRYQLYRTHETRPPAHLMVMGGRPRPKTAERTFYQLGPDEGFADLEAARAYLGRTKLEPGQFVLLPYLFIPPAARPVTAS